MNNQKGKTGTKRRIIVIFLFAVAVWIGALLFLAPAYQGDFVPLPEVSEEVKAQRILEYRQKHGPFASLQELDQVEGIGPKTIGSWEGLAWVS